MLIRVSAERLVQLARARQAAMSRPDAAAARAARTRCGSEHARGAADGGRRRLARRGAGGVRRIQPRQPHQGYRTLRRAPFSEGWVRGDHDAAAAPLAAAAAAAQVQGSRHARTGKLHSSSLQSLCVRQACGLLWNLQPGQ